MSVPDPIYTDFFIFATEAYHDCVMNDVSITERYPDIDAEAMKVIRSDEGTDRHREWVIRTNERLDALRAKYLKLQ